MSPQFKLPTEEQLQLFEVAVACRYVESHRGAFQALVSFQPKTLEEALIWPRLKIEAARLFIRDHQSELLPLSSFQPKTLEGMLAFIKLVSGKAKIASKGALIRDTAETFIIEGASTLEDFPVECVVLNDFLQRQQLIPGLQIGDVIDTLTVDDLKTYQHIQILRRKIQANDDGRYAAARSLAEKIPLKLADPIATGWLTQMIGSGHPYNKKHIQEQELPRIILEQIGRELTSDELRIQTRWIKNILGKKAKFRPVALPLRVYRKWLRIRTEEAFAKWVKEVKQPSPPPSKRKPRKNDDDGDSIAPAYNKGLTARPRAGRRYSELDEEDFTIDIGEGDLGMISLNAYLEDSLQEKQEKRIKAVIDRLIGKMKGKVADAWRQILACRCTYKDAWKKYGLDNGLAPENTRQLMRRAENALRTVAIDEQLDRLAPQGETYIRPFDGTKIEGVYGIRGRLEIENLLIGKNQLSPAIYHYMLHSENPATRKIIKVLGSDLSGPRKPH